MANKLSDEEKEERRLEKEHLAEMKRLKKWIECQICGYFAKGKNLREQSKDMYRHIKEKHPELRKFEL